MIGQARATSALTIVVLLIGSSNLTATGLRYRIELVGQTPTTNPYQSVDYVGGLNNRGEVAFSYSRSIQIAPQGYRSVNESYVATHAGIVSISDLGGESARAHDLTDTGLVVGGASSADTPFSRFDEVHYYEPFVSQGGRTIAIPTPERGFSSAAAANNRGEVVGTASTRSSITAFKWSESDGYEHLGDFGAFLVHVVDINERSDILINLTPQEVLQFGNYHYQGPQAIIYNAGSIIRVPDSQFRITLGSAINDNGAVVGSFGTIPGVETHAYIWDQGNGFRDIGIDGEYSYATDINNAGIVIGAFADAYPQSTIPFVYTEQAGRQPLIDLIDNLADWSRLDSASRINDHGQIVGIGWSNVRGRRIYLASPIPEPTTITGFLLFWVCVITASRNRARR